MQMNVLMVNYLQLFTNIYPLAFNIFLCKKFVQMKKNFL